ncbi:HAD family hydrolase [Megamonas hypermegale]|uniref:HAD family hydrolase n=1 Tax=Megamonas hypermegale TaxID=158847 RepID=UPI00320B4E9E
MLTDKKFIFFDMDGTLIDSVGVWNQIDQKLIENQTNKIVDEIIIQNDRDTQLQKFSSETNPYLCYCQYLKEKYNFQLSPEEIIKLRYEIAQDFLQNIIDYKPQADLIIKKLKEKKFTLAITTTTKRTNMEIYRTLNKNIISKASLDEYFDLIYTREDVAKIKPNPEVYLKAMQAFNAKPEQCIVFEDSLVGIKAAKNAGLKTVAIYDKYSNNDIEEIKQQADFFINNYAELLSIIENL